VAIIGSAPPVKFGFPECAKEGRIASALPRELAIPITLAEAEKATQAAHQTESAETARGKAGERETAPEDNHDTDEATSDDDPDQRSDDGDVRIFPEDVALFSTADKRPSSKSSYPSSEEAVLDQINEE
jgi:hypothetical protein